MRSVKANHKEKIKDWSCGPLNFKRLEKLEKQVNEIADKEIWFMLSVWEAGTICFLESRDSKMTMLPPI